MPTPTPFVVAVSGSRSLVSPADRARVFEILDAEAAELLACGFTLAFHLGDASGVDMFALEWCRERGYPRTIFFASAQHHYDWLDIVDFLAVEWSSAGGGTGSETGILVSDWNRDGKAAGPIRNHAMIAGGNGTTTPKADLLVAIWDGRSPGTRNARATAKNNGVDCHPHEIPLPTTGRPLPQLG